MQASGRRSGQCIFCAFRSFAGFSTSSAAAGESKKFKASNTKRERDDNDALYRGRFDTLDRAVGIDSVPTKSRVDRRNSRTIPLDRFDRYGEGSAPRSSATFRPSSGEFFDRRKPGFRGRPVFQRKQKWTSREEAIQGCLEEIEQNLHLEVIFAKLKMESAELDDRFSKWRANLERNLATKHTSDLEIARLGRLWLISDENGFRLHMKYALYGHLASTFFSKADLEDQENLANLRWPTEWFPATRGFQREFHLHVGPTNSGKTYQALKRLEEAETGLYAGPLRLLAHEVYMRLNARGQRCNLITGDERKTSDDDPQAPMSSCTVEMIPLNAKLDVAIIDEIQMIGSEDRGWAWTQAVLGIMAKEVHCCGEERVVPIMQELVAMCGEKLHVHRYKRLSPLQMSTRSLDGNLRNLQKGDCVVAFRVLEIHALRQVIEKMLKVKVAVIYGSLPPETRAQQARLFNDPNSGYDILIASNAIGMGLNLSIKRLIFHTSQKFSGANWGTLSVAETKQIAGRAGRYSTAEQDMKKSTSNLDIVAPSATQAEVSTTRSPGGQSGYVTTLERFDYPIIEKLMKSEPEPLTSAGVQPPAYVVERFAKYFPPGTPFAYLLMRLNELAETSSRFFLCDLRQQIAIADVIEPVEGLTTTDRLIFCSSPIEPRKPGEPRLAQAYARFVAESRAVSIVEVEELNFDLLDDDFEASRSYLAQLEGLHKGVIIWNWLSFRFTGVFINPELAAHVKELVEKRIEETLERLSFDYDRMRKSREKAILQMLEQENQERQQKDENTTLQTDKADEGAHSDDTAVAVDERVSKWLERMAEIKDENAGLPSGLNESSASASDSGHILETTEPPAADFEESLIEEPDLEDEGELETSVTAADAEAVLVQNDSEGLAGSTAAVEDEGYGTEESESLATNADGSQSESQRNGPANRRIAIHKDLPLPLTHEIQPSPDALPRASAASR